MPVAIDECHKKLVKELPEQIAPGVRRQWSQHVSRCIVDTYVVLAGAENLDPARCQKR